MKNLVRTPIARCFAALCAPACTGCVVPYAYIHTERISAIPLGEAAPDVTIARIDATASSAHSFDRAVSDARISLVPLPADAHECPAQQRLACARGIWILMPALSHDLRTDDYLELRVYRRGFRTIVLDSAYDGTPLTWIAATSVEEQERAIDAMFSTNLRHAAGDPCVAGEPPAFCHASESLSSLPRSAADDFRGLWRFAAAEYAHLAASLPLDPTEKDRVARKAALLRRLADAKRTGLVRGGSSE